MGKLIAYLNIPNPDKRWWQFWKPISIKKPLGKIKYKEN